MKLEKSIMNMPTTGECEIDIDKAVKYFDDKCFITQWHDDYRMVRSAYNGKVNRLKATISKKDALMLIEKLDLKSISSGIFSNAATWKLINNDEKDR